MHTPRYSFDTVDIYQVIVGPLDNNVFVVRDKHTGHSVLIDAADEHQLLLDMCRELDVKQVLETHGHPDHIQAVPEVRAAGISVLVASEDAILLPSYDQTLKDGEAIEVGATRILIIHTPGHTPGSTCFKIEAEPVLFSGDTLFPGGPGATHFPGGDFTAIINSIENRLFRAYGPETLVLPGHGRATTLGNESPHLDEWIARGW
jgi:glyoxylase-like metal-dependent hydrolase (beta-lactamase superfamily II)